MTGQYITGANDALYWRPTVHSPYRKLTAPGSSEAQREAAKAMHEGCIKSKTYSPRHHPPCVVTYARSHAPTPWLVRWRWPVSGQAIETTRHASRDEALQSAPHIMKLWEDMGLGFD